MLSLFRRKPRRRGDTESKLSPPEAGTAPHKPVERTTGSEKVFIPASSGETLMYYIVSSWVLLTYHTTSRATDSFQCRSGQQVESFFRR